MRKKPTNELEIKVKRQKGPVRPPDTRPWKKPSGLGMLATDDVVAVRWTDHWKIAVSWKRNGASILCKLDSGSVVEVDSARQIMILPGEVAKSWKGVGGF
jgi:hypothetical protein